jgi:hypothetical protein
MLDGSGESLDLVTVSTSMMYGETRATLFGGPIRSKKMRFADFTQANLLELQTLWLATSGPVTPFIWIESYEAVSTAAATTEQDCIFGRLLVDKFDWTWVDHLYSQPPSFVIQSLGRGVGT